MTPIIRGATADQSTSVVALQWQPVTRTRTILSTAVTLFAMTACSAAGDAGQTTANAATAAPSPSITSTSTAVTSESSYASVNVSISTAEPTDSASTVVDSGATTAEGFNPNPVTFSYPSTLTPDDLATAMAAGEAYNGVVVFLNMALSDPTAQDWVTQVRNKMADPIAPQWEDNITHFIESDWHQVGEYVVTAEPTDVVDDVVQFSACVDTTKLDVLDGLGESVSSHARLTTNITVARYDGIWLVNSIAPINPRQEC